MSVDKHLGYTVKEAAVIMGMSTSTIKTKCHSGELICSNIGTPTRKIFRIKQENIENFFN